MRLKTFTPLFTLLAGFLLFANANLATAQKSESQKITLQNSGSDIILEWASGDKLMLCFEHGTNIYHEDAPIIPESISADGKSAQFNITVPAEIPAGAIFNLYGVYQRTDSKTTNGGIFDLGTKKYRLEAYEDDNVTLDKTGTYGDGIINPMLHFSKTNISNTLPLAIGDITLNHAGWIMALHFTNNSGTAITLPSSIYFDSFDSERKWAYGEKTKLHGLILPLKQFLLRKNIVLHLI